MRNQNVTMRAGRVALLACGAMLAVVPAFAQQGARAPPPPPPPGEHQGPGGPGGRMGGRMGGPGGPMREMMAKLNLTEDQRKQVQAIMESERPKMEALRDNTSLDQKDRRKEMMKIHEDVVSKVKPILTEEQRKKFDEMQKEQREEGGRGRGRRAGGDDGPPPPPPPPPAQ